MLDSKCRMQDTRYRKTIQDIGLKIHTLYRIQHTKCRIQDTGYKIEDTRYKIEDTRYKNDTI